MPMKKGKRQEKKKGQGAKGTGQKKKKGQGSRVKGQNRGKKEIKKTKKAKPTKKTVRAKTSKKSVSKAKSLALPTRADMVSAMAHEFRRDILVVPGKCNACADKGGPQCVEACRKAIAYQHKEVKPIPRITIKKSQGFNIPILCHNCEEAPCMSACMTGTRRRLSETGWVETDYNRCVGCWMCVMVCPFGAIIRSDEEHLARKCDGCTSYKTAPCAAACKPGAIVQTGAYSYDYEKRKEYAERLGYQQRLLSSTENLFNSKD